MANLQDILTGKLFDLLLWSKAISVSSDFHSQCGYVQDIISNDITGIVNTVLDYAIDSASSASYRIECTDKTLEKLLNQWLSGLNDELLGRIPTGTFPLAKEYFYELWKGSSFCLLRAKQWQKLEGSDILVPKALYFANGSSIYVNRPDSKNFVLGSDEYYLAPNKKTKLPTAKEQIVIQKNGARWHDEYPIPYVVRKGIYKNFKALQILSDKGDEVITKALPYLFLLSVGSEGLTQAGITYKTEDLKKAQTDLRADLEKYKGEPGKLPTLIDNFDKKYSHLIPDFRPILSQELFTQGYRAILAGLGFIDLLEISPSRQEARINPRPFLANVNAGVDGFKSIITDLAKMIIAENKEKHPKFFSENNKIEVVSSPLKINTEQILDEIRIAYDRGNISKRSFVETLGYDYDQEKLRRTKEAEDGDEDTMYPQVTMNQEDKGKDTFVPSKPRNEKNEKQGKKPGTPEANNYKNAELEEDLEIAPYKNVEDLLKKHPSMKKYPKGALEVFIEVFNKSLPKGEDYAYPVAYTAMKRWLKKHGYKKVGDKWVKSEENK